MEAMNLNNDEQKVTPKEAAKIARRSVRTIYAWIWSGRLKSSQPGGRRRRGSPHDINLSDLRRVLDGDDADITAYEAKEPKP